MKNSYYYAILAAVVIGVFFYTNSKYDIDENYYLQILEEKKAESYDGKILKHYQVQEGKYPKSMVSLSDGSQIILKRSFWEKCAVGDSIRKIKEESFVTLKKPDGSKIVYDYKKWIDGLIKEINE